MFKRKNMKRYVWIFMIVIALMSLTGLVSVAETAMSGDIDSATVLLEDGTVATAAEGSEEHQSNFFATFWALLPPIVAIALALITKEVYMSLFVGIVAGGLLYANFSPMLTVTSILNVMIESVGNASNVGIFMFLIMLGILVSLMTKAGGSAAYGQWAASKIKSKRGSMLATFGLGLLIFVDDYFNCLTVGSVMSPVTDKFKVSRAKLAYIIDSTAAPICIIAPISSWAAAVTSSTEGSDIDGFAMFIQAIPYNFYALLTIVMVLTLSLLKLDFGPMRKYEALAEKGDLGIDLSYGQTERISSKGKVLDLVVPIISLIAFCIMGMVYTGGFFEGESFINAFANCDAPVGLVLGSFAALVLTFVLYMSRRIISFKDFAASLPEGFKAMVPALLILAFAWTLSGFCRDMLGAGIYVEGLVSGNATASLILPAILFLIALGLAFSTGTSWGTFGILIPIVLSIFPEMGEILVISISACLAGAVCGDHMSPISDTTIMSSTGAKVNHIVHVSTQIPYALLVGSISFVGFILAGFLQSVIVLPLLIVVLVGILILIKKFTKK